MDTDAHVMSCMEVWGGNHAVDQGVAMPGLDLWVHSQPLPGHAQGGDVHSLSSCGTGRISRMVLADVSGHGESVGSLARNLNTLMRSFVNFVDQRRFVAALNHALADSESGSFATSITLTFFAPSRQLDLCNAGHPRPLLRRARTGRWQLLVPADPPTTLPPTAPATRRQAGTVPRNLPLGVLLPTEYEQFGLRLEEGDLVLAYTDALIEARGPDGTMLGEQGLLDCMSRLDAEKPERLLPALLESLAAFRGMTPLDDDLTLLLLRHHGGATNAPLRARLAATLRFLGVLLRHTVPFGEHPPIPWPELSRANVLGAFSRRASESWRGPAGSGVAREEQ